MSGFDLWSSVSWLLVYINNFCPVRLPLGLYSVEATSFKLFPLYFHWEPLNDRTFKFLGQTFIILPIPGFKKKCFSNIKLIRALNSTADSTLCTLLYVYWLLGTWEKHTYAILDALALFLPLSSQISWREIVAEVEKIEKGNKAVVLKFLAL